MRSRWSLLAAPLRRLRRARTVVIEHDHDHDHAAVTAMSIRSAPWTTCTTATAGPWR